MRYAVKFHYVDIVDTGFEGLEEFVERSAIRYFADYDSKEMFLQELDMAGEPGTYVMEELSVEDDKAELYYNMATVIYYLDVVTFGAFHKSLSHKFYDLMHKALVDVGSDDLCYKFDQRIRL